MFCPNFEGEEILKTSNDLVLSSSSSRSVLVICFNHSSLTSERRRLVNNGGVNYDNFPLNPGRDNRHSTTEQNDNCPPNLGGILGT